MCEAEEARLNAELERVKLELEYVWGLVEGRDLERPGYVIGGVP